MEGLETKLALFNLLIKYFYAFSLITHLLISLPQSCRINISRKILQIRKQYSKFAKWGLKILHQLWGGWQVCGRLTPAWGERGKYSINIPPLLLAFRASKTPLFIPLFLSTGYFAVSPHLNSIHLISLHFSFDPCVRRCLVRWITYSVLNRA